MTRWRGLAVAAVALLVACDDRPVVVVAVIPASVDVPALSTFSRVTLAVDRCDANESEPVELLTLDASPGSRPEQELDIPPGVKLSVWLAAWVPCPASECAPAGTRPRSGVCLCEDPAAPQAIAYEGCSSFTRFEAGTESAVTLSLSATRTPALCPTSRNACP